jgi:hypothetical protein
MKNLISGQLLLMSWGLPSIFDIGLSGGENFYGIGQ